MDLYYKQEITVGALVLIALAVMVGGLMWLTGRSIGGGRRVAVSVEFQTVSGLTESDPVMISGVTVGRVAEVRLEEVGRVLVRLDVERRVRPRVDATAAVRSLDFLGAKFVAYTPGTAEDLLPDEAVIAGVGETDLASSAVELTDEATRTLLRAQALLSDETAAQIRRTLSAAERAMAVVARVGGGPLAASAESTLAAVHGAAAALDSTLSNPAISESLSQLDEISVSVREMTEGLAAVTTNLALLLAQMRSPEGTIGKALTDSTVYHDLHEVLQSLKLLLDDIRERPGRYIKVSVF